jgi:ketose-bisphosphate aldolase
MRVPFPELLQSAAARGQAVGAFTSYDLEACLATLRAAEAAAAPVMVLVSRQSFAAPGGELLVAALCAAVDRSPVRACVQLDHVDDLGLIERALDAGAGAVMADGSRWAWDENVAFVREAAALAGRHGAAVEAELGGITGDEDVAEAVAAGALTDPDEAAAFVTATGAACLAVSIGNVHGRYREPPALDWARLEAIRARVDVPLSLHGASGIPDGDVQRAIRAGVAKVNVNTELREAYLAATADGIGDALPGARVLELHARQSAAVEEVVAAKLRLCTPP